MKNQKFCSHPACRKASKAFSQAKWVTSEKGKDYFKGSEHTERVKTWRKKHPGYWKRRGPLAQEPLQETISGQPPDKEEVKRHLAEHALQDQLFMQPAVIVGLIAHLAGFTLQDEIDAFARELQHRGSDILGGMTSNEKKGSCSYDTEKIA